MNPKNYCYYCYYYFYFYYLLLSQGANVPEPSPDITAHLDVTANTKAGVTALSNAFSPPTTTEIHIITDGDSIPSGVDVKHVRVSPGKPILITVDPCDKEKKQKSDPRKEDFPSIIPQTIVPLENPVDLTPEERILSDQLEGSVEGNERIDGMKAEELDGEIRKVIEFFNLIELTGHEIENVNMPQLTLLGESDEIKRIIIDKLTNRILDENEGSLLNLNVPIRFKLVKDEKLTKPLVKINNKEETGNIYESLNGFTDPNSLVNVEIQSSKVSSIIFQSIPETLSIREKGKYLKHFWNFTLVAGSIERSFDEWENLKLIRSFDREMKRIFIISEIEHESSPKNDNWIKAVESGLKASFPSITPSKMFHIKTSTPDPSDPLDSLDMELIRAMQKRFLKIWSILKPKALESIQNELKRNEKRIKEFEAFEASSIEDKFKGLIGQVNSMLGDNLMYLMEEKDVVGCSSLLESVTESIFGSQTKSKLRNKFERFDAIFKEYQEEISRINPIIDNEEIDELIGKLRSDGPKDKIIKEIGNLIFQDQNKNLNLAKKTFLHKIAIIWRGKLEFGLEGRLSLEPFEGFKNFVKETSFSILKDKMDEIQKLNDQLEEIEENSKWIYNFYNSKTENIWIEMLKADSLKSAKETLFNFILQGFTNTCNIQASLQVKIVIDKLLSHKTRNLIIKQLQGVTENREKLSEMSTEAKDEIKRTQTLINNLKKILT